MTTFHVSYYKILQNSVGHSFKCLQKTIDVEASTPIAALKLIDDRGLSLPDCDCLEVTSLANAGVAPAVQTPGLPALRRRRSGNLPPSPSH